MQFEQCLNSEMHALRRRTHTGTRGMILRLLLSNKWTNFWPFIPISPYQLSSHRKFSCSSSVTTHIHHLYCQGLSHECVGFIASRVERVNLRQGDVRREQEKEIFWKRDREKRLNRKAPRERAEGARGGDIEIGIERDRDSVT